MIFRKRVIRNPFLFSTVYTNNKCSIKLIIMVLTDKEIAVLKSIALSDYVNLEFTDKRLIEFPTWMFDSLYYSDLKGKSFSGTISSLTKKGLIGTDTKGDKGNIHVHIKDTWTIWMTKEGFEILQSYL